MQFSRLPTFLAALAAVTGTAVAQATYSGAITYTLAPVLGACGRVCSATYTCTQSGYAHNCYGGDAAVPQAIFQAHYNASLGANSPICKSSVVVIDSATYNIGSNVCTYFTTGGASDLQLAQGDFNAPGITGTWFLNLPSS